MRNSQARNYAMQRVERIGKGVVRGGVMGRVGCEGRSVRGGMGEWECKGRSGRVCGQEWEWGIQQ